MGESTLAGVVACGSIVEGKLKRLVGQVDAGLLEGVEDSVLAWLLSAVMQSQLARP